MKFTLICLVYIAFGACSHKSEYNYQQSSTQVIDSLKKLSQNFYDNNLSFEFDDYLKEAVAVAKTSKDSEALFDLYLMVGHRYRKSAKYDKSIEVVQNALMLAEIMNNDFFKAKATHEIAVNFRKINDNAKALKLHMQALELSENVNDTFLIHCSLNGVGNVYFDYKDYPKAIEYFHKSLQFLGTEKPNYLGEAINSNLLGEAWLFLGNTDSALYYLNRSFSANVKIGSDIGKAICHNGMGLVYQQRKEYNKALDEHKTALIICEKLDDKFYQTMCLNNIGTTYIGMRECKMAELFLLKALTIATKIDNTRFALDASLKLGELYNTQGDIHNSFKYNVMALAYKDSITDEIQKQNTHAMNILYKAEKQEREIVILKQNSELAKFKITRQRYIFLALVSLIAIAVLLFYLIYRQRTLKSKLNEIGLEQKLLRAQLNPHFVFNSLSAVQNFILKNDKKAASDYLVNFSRLMRNILMGSGTDFILLEQELEMLDDYLKLQQLRFQGKFDYFFEFANEINPSTCLVPPMLVQPFVENAIEHGLRDIDRQGTIIIRFERKDHILLIEVEDNGRGIIQQKESDKKKGHISMATKITQQRMQNLQAITKLPCKFQVIDNKLVNNLQGVLVLIEIPWQDDN